MRNNYLKTLFLLLSILVAGCRDDVKKGEMDNEDDTSASFDNIPVIDLTDDEMAAFCGELFDATLVATTDLRDLASTRLCALAGASAAESVANEGGTAEEMILSCDVMVQTCETVGVDSLGLLLQGVSSLESEGAFCVGVQDIFGDCDATTSEMSGCYLAMLASELAQYEQELASLPDCSAFSPAFFEQSPAADESVSLTDIPMACVAVAMKCPDMATSVLAFPGL